MTVATKTITKKKAHNQVDLKDLTNFIINYCNINEIDINHSKLQKLLYYVQAWHLVYFEYNLFNEQPNAWANGPVYKTVYDLFKKNKPNTTLKKLFDTDLKESEERLQLTKDQKRFLYDLLSHYGLMSYERLIMLTLKEDPWNQARKGLDIFESTGNIISQDSMFKYYSSLNNK